MSEDLKLLIDAIESLRQDENLLKDYIYPIVIAFFSACMGALAGYWGILWQQHVEAEKNKIDATNKLLIEVVDCFQNLQAIKDNYLGKLTGMPHQRLACIPPILMYHRPAKPDFSGLSYLARALKREEDQITSPANLAYVMRIFSNYNNLLEMWKTRNAEVAQIFPAIVSRHSNTAVAYINKSDMIDAIGPQRFARAIHLNEEIIKITDNTLSDFSNLFTKLPQISETLISKNTIKSYGGIYKLELDQEKLTLLLSKVPVNQAELDQILEHEIQARS